MEETMREFPDTVHEFCVKYKISGFGYTGEDNVIARNATQAIRKVMRMNMASYDDLTYVNVECLSTYVIKKDEGE